MWYQPIQSINLGGLEIQVWGMMLALGTVFAWILFDYNLMWRKIKFDTSWLVLGFIFFSIVGARLVHVLLNLNLYSQNWIDVLYVWQGGMASFGAFIFGIIFIYFYRHRFLAKFNSSDFLDATVPSMCLALFLSRTGCFLINDHIGKISSMPWSIWTMDSLRHPISLYYSLIALFLFVLSLNWYYLKMHHGRIIWIVLIIYAALRLLVDLFFKDFFAHSASFWATMITCVIIVIFSVFMLYNRGRNIS